MHETPSRVPPSEIKNSETRVRSQESEKSAVKRAMEHLNSRSREVGNEYSQKIGREHYLNLIKRGALVFALLANNTVEAAQAVRAETDQAVGQSEQAEELKPPAQEAEETPPEASGNPEEGASIEALKQRLHDGGEVDLAQLENTNPGLNEMLIRTPAAEHTRKTVPFENKTSEKTDEVKKEESPRAEVSTWSKFKNSLSGLFKK